MAILLGIVAGLFVANSRMKVSDLARQIEQQIISRLKAQEAHVQLDGPSGYRVLRGNFRKTEVRIRGFDADALQIADIQGKVTATTTQIKKRKMGRIGRLDVLLEDFIYDEIRVAEAGFHFTRLRYDVSAAIHHRQFRVLDIERGTATVCVHERSLEERVVRMVDGVEDARLKLSTDRVTLSGKRKIFFVAIPFSVDGKLAGKGNEVHFVEPRLKVSILPLPDGFTEWLLAEINPVYAFDARQELPFKVDITSLRVNEGHLTAEAYLQLRLQNDSRQGQMP